MFMTNSKMFRTSSELFLDKFQLHGNMHTFQKFLAQFGSIHWWDITHVKVRDFVSWNCAKEDTKIMNLCQKIADYAV